MMRLLYCLMLLCYASVPSFSFAAQALAKTTIHPLDEDTFRVTIDGSTIDVYFSDPLLHEQRDLFLEWVSSSAQVVHHFYGQFPVDSLEVNLIAFEGGGISGGRQFGGETPVVRVTVGHLTSQEKLQADWIMPHEMSHLALSTLPLKNRWFAEGMAVYVETLARAQLDILPEELVWSGFIKNMPNGLPQADDQGLDNTPTWGRRYWGGALFCLLADLDIRQRTNNQRSLQDALKGIVKAGFNATTDSSIEPILSAADKAVGEEVLLPLYLAMRDKPVSPDLDELWQSLGVRLVDKKVIYDDDAPLAAMRKTMLQAN